MANNEEDCDEWIKAIKSMVKKAGGLVNISYHADGVMGPKNPKGMDRSPTLSQINDLLIEHERKLHKKID
jgi:hypothetical protein